MGIGTCDEEWEKVVCQSAAKGDWFGKARKGEPEDLGLSKVHKRFVFTRHHATEEQAKFALAREIELFEAKP